MKNLKNTFSAKLTLLLIFVIFMPMAILSTYISIRIYRTALKNDTAANQNNLESIASNIDSYFKGFTHITDAIFVSEELQELLLSPPASPYERLLADRRYNVIMRNITVNNYDIENIYLLAADGTEYFYNGNRYLPDIREECEEYFNTKAYDFPLLGGFCANNYRTGNIPVYIPVIVQPLYNLETREYLGLVVVQFYSNTFSKLLDYNNSHTFLSDTDGNIIYDSSGNHLGNNIGEVFPQGLAKPFLYEGTMMLPTSIYLKNGCRLIQLKNYDEGNITYFKETVPVIWLFFACTLIFILLSILLSRRLVAPVRKLQTAMTTLKPDGLSSPVDIRTHDEFEVLGDSYNHMLDKLRLFIEKSYKQEIQNLNAELRALQLQINPHFLYNALESINSMAQIQHQPEISRMVCCLADMFRYTTQQSEKLIPLKDEIQYIRNYYQFQNIIFDNKVSLQYRIDDTAMCFPVPKLTLQPLIENCFNHALTEDKELTIVVSAAQQNQTLHIRVEDNGKGILCDRLSEIQESLNRASGSHLQETSIGLSNINQRLRMIYKPGSGLTLSGSTDKGTVVHLKLIREVTENV